MTEQQDRPSLLPSSRVLRLRSSGVSTIGKAPKGADEKPGFRRRPTAGIGALLMKTRYGYSFIAPWSYSGSGGLLVKGLLAARAYR